MTPQQIFDTVATHLFAQGKQALRDDGIHCAYRGQNGTKCAVGCLISDDQYFKGIEGHDVCGVLADYSFECPDWFRQERYLLVDLQDVHDDEDHWGGPEALSIALQRVARIHNLSPTVLDNLRFPEGTS